MEGHKAMRLDDFDNNINVEHQGSGGGFGGMPMGGGSIGCGGLILLLIAALVFGVAPGSLMSESSGPVVQQQQVP